MTPALTLMTNIGKLYTNIHSEVNVKNLAMTLFYHHSGSELNLLANFNEDLLKKQTFAWI